MVNFHLTFRELAALVARDATRAALINDEIIPVSYGGYDEAPFDEPSFLFFFFFILKLYDTERSGNLCQMKLPTRFTSVETGSKLEMLSQLLYHTFFFNWGPSLYIE